MKKILLQTSFTSCVKILFLLFCLHTSLLTQSQENILIPLNSSDWFPLYEDENVILLSKVMECADPAGGPTFNYVFVSLENKKDKKVRIEWHYDLFNKTECFTCIDPGREYHFDFILEPGESVIPDCTKKSVEIEEKESTVFFATFIGKAEFNSVPDVVKVMLSNLTTNILN